MKKIITSLFVLLVSCTALAQSNAERKFNARAGKASYDLFNQFNTFNYMFFANKYLKDNSTISVNVLASDRLFYDYKTKLVKTGRIDANGNEILHLELYDKNDRLAGKVVPDFDDCSLFGQLIYYYTDNNGKEKVDRRSVTLTPNDKQVFVVNGTDSQDMKFMTATKAATFNELLAAKGYFLTETFYRRNYNYSGHQEAVKKRWDDDHAQLYEAAWNWTEKMLAKSKEKPYIDMMKEAKIEGDAVLQDASRSGITDHPIRVQNVYDAQGNISEIVFQFPYIDGKYYDKPQFYFKATRNKDGYFQAKNSDKDCPLYGGVIIPFEGHWLICSEFNKTYSVSQIISTDLFNNLAFRVLRNHSIFTGRVNQADDNSGMLEFRNDKYPKYKEWVTLKLFEKSYDHNRDPLHLGNFLNSYIKGIKVK